MGMVLFMHIFMIDKLPRGLNVDEVGSGYDAYTLGRYGVDRWRNSWPLYLVNYRDGQNILYTYLLIPIIRIFGANIFSVRSVIVISAVVMAVYGGKLFKEIFEDDRAEIMFVALFAISPVFITMLRFGLESHLMMSAATVMLYYAAMVAKEGKRKHYVLLGISSGIVLYTYALSYLCVPVFLLLTLIYLIIWKKKEIKASNTFLTAVIFAVLAAPLAVVQIINYFDLPELKLGVFTFTKLPKYRSSELTFQDFFRKIYNAAYSTVLHDDLAYNSSTVFHNFYIISVPFMGIGLAWSIYRFFISLKNREKCTPAVFVLLWAGAEYLMAGVLSNAPGYPNLTRMNGVLISLIIFICEGIWVVFSFLKGKKKLPGSVRVLAAGCLAASYMIFFIFFARYYFNGYDAVAYPYKWLFFEEYDKDALAFLEDEENGYADAHVYLPFIYTYYLWWTQADPYETCISLDDPMTDPESIGRFSFMDQGHTLNGEYLFYRYGYSGPEIELFRKWHFEEYDMGSYILFTDPFHNSVFFKKDFRLSDDLVIENAYVTIVDGEKDMSFYGWIRVNDSSEYRVRLITDKGTEEAEIIAENGEDGGTVCFIISSVYEDFYQSGTQLFNVYKVKNGEETLLVSYDMKKDV